MARSSHLRWAVVICLASGLAWHGSAATVPMPNPDDATVADGVFRSRYFDLSYPLPSGWMEGLAGPDASGSGYYVLGTFVPAGELSGTIVVAAQDIFFATAPLEDAMAMADEFGRSMVRVDGMQIDRPPVFRSTFITKLRCHFLSFNLTAKSPEFLSALAHSLNNLGPAEDTQATKIDPVCISGYANADHLLTRIDPPPISPSFTSIPVRIVIARDGTVKHAHVIHATAAQRDGIEAALSRWKLRPPNMNGSATEIETGLVITFTPAGAVRYRPIDPGRIAALQNL
jgi:hypothetical protein